MVADQHPSAYRQCGAWRVYLRGLCRSPVLVGQKQGRPGALRLDGVCRELYRRVRSVGPAVCRVLAHAGNLSVQPADGHHIDGRISLLAVHHPGDADRGIVPRVELLFLAGDYLSYSRIRGEVPESLFLVYRYYWFAYLLSW